MTEERGTPKAAQPGAGDRDGAAVPAASRTRAAARSVRLVYFDACPNWSTADRRLRALAEELGFELELQSVSSPVEVEAAGLRGSPTILVDGRDPYATAEAPLSMSCRLYSTPAGPAGSPTIEQLREILIG